MPNYRILSHHHWPVNMQNKFGLDIVNETFNNSILFRTYKANSSPI